MYADLMLLHASAISLGHDFHEEVKAGQNYCQFHYYLLQSCWSSQISYSRKPSVDTFYSTFSHWPRLVH